MARAVEQRRRRAAVSFSVPAAPGETAGQPTRSGRPARRLAPSGAAAQTPNPCLKFKAGRWQGAPALCRRLSAALPACAAGTWWPLAGRLSVCPSTETCSRETGRGIGRPLSTLVGAEYQTGSRQRLGLCWICLICWIC